MIYYDTRQKPYTTTTSMFCAVFTVWVFFESTHVCEPGTTLAVVYVYGWSRPTWVVSPSSAIKVFLFVHVLLEAVGAVPNENVSRFRWLHFLCKKQPFTILTIFPKLVYLKSTSDRFLDYKGIFLLLEKWQLYIRYELAEWGKLRK